MEQKPFKIALGQIPLVMGNKTANLAAVIAAIEAAGKAKVDLVVLPECCLAGWLSPEATRDAETIPGPFSRHLGRLAKKFQMSIVVGMEERQGAKIFNSALFLGKDGSLLGQYRKISELPLALEIYSTGKEPCLVEIEGRKIGLNICADNWTPDAGKKLFRQGAEFLVSPCAWAIQPGKERTNLKWIQAKYRRLLRGENACLVAVNSVGKVTTGPWKGRVLQGNSLVLGPGGKTLFLGPTNKAGLFVITLKRLASYRFGSA